LLTVSEAAKHTVLSETALRAAIRRGDLHAERIGGRIWLRPEELTRALGPLFRPDTRTA
jgi:excisionase family DNA binding protein